MHLFQSSSFKLVCALVVSTLLANAIPHERGSDENVFLILYGNKIGDTNNAMYPYPEVELTPSQSTTSQSAAGYDVVGSWKGDGNDEKATALRYDDHMAWATTVYIQRAARKLLAAGYDTKRDRGWWTISRADE